MLLSTPPGVSRRARRHSWALFLCRVRYFRLNFWDGNGSPPGENEVGSRRHRDSGPLAVRCAETPRRLGGLGESHLTRIFLNRQPKLRKVLAICLRLVYQE